MPRTRPHDNGDSPASSCQDEPGDATEREDLMNALVSHCLAAHAIIGEHGTDVMRRLIDLLLFEIGSEFGEDAEIRRRPRDMN